MAISEPQWVVGYFGHNDYTLTTSTSATPTVTPTPSIDGRIAILEAMMKQLTTCVGCGAEAFVLCAYCKMALVELREQVALRMYKEVTESLD